MTKTEILDELQPIFQRVLEVSNLKIDLETTAQDIAEWDSLNHATLMAAAQDHFQVRFSLRDVLNFKRVDDLCELIQKAKQS